MEEQPLLADSQQGYSTPVKAHPPYHSRISYDQLPSSTSSYCGDNYIFPPERNVERKRTTTEDSLFSYNGSSPYDSYFLFNEIPRPHKPLFTSAISLVNIALVIYACCAGGIVKVSFAPKLEVENVNSFGCVAPSNNCSLSEKAARYTLVNGYVGPNASFLVHVGAQFTPCIRDVSEIRKKVHKIFVREANYTCCELNRECGMVNFQKCINKRGKNLGGARNCYVLNPRCSKGVTLRPCCVGMHSGCVVTTRQSCSYQWGTWHENKLTCSEVNCLEGICGMSGVENKYDGNQGYRLMTAVFLHLGIIHLLVNLLFQIPVGFMVEKRIGWMRMGLIYLMSGLGGSPVSAMFNPLTPVAGASGALFGLIALLLVQLVQYWKFVQRPCCVLFVLIAILVVSFGIGTLPYIGNFVHIGGFIFGLFASISFVPHITCLPERRNTWIWYAKCAAFIVLVALLVLCFVALYCVKNIDLCPWCRHIDCVNWHKGLCPDSKHDGMA